MSDEALRYPVGRLAPPGPPLAPDALTAAVAEIAAFPAALRAATGALPDAVLDTAYRPGGWTVRQVVHHVADSHSHAALRFKWAVAEDAPHVSDYDQAAWVALPDARGPVGISLNLIDALHARWVVLMQAMAPADWERTFVHSVNGPTRLDRAAALYAWHGRHHLAHIALAAG